MRGILLGRIKFRNPGRASLGGHLLLVLLLQSACRSEVGDPGAQGGTAGAPSSTSVAGSSESVGGRGGTPTGSLGGAGALGGVGGNSSALPACATFGAPVQVGTAEATALSSLSGLVASRSQAGVYFAHPDRGGAVFFAIDENGHTLESYSLSGYIASDLEDIAIGPAPNENNRIFLGDIGDNTARSGSGAGRREIVVLRFAEPVLSSKSTGNVVAIADWEALRFTYPDRPHDAETLMVDPTNGDLIIVTREADGRAYVFSAKAATPIDTPTVLEQLAVIQVGSQGANAGDISPTGDRALIRTYTSALLYARSAGQTWASAFQGTAILLPVADEAQSEGATFAADGQSWLSSGEQTAAIFRANAACGAVAPTP